MNRADFKQNSCQNGFEAVVVIRVHEFGY